MAFLPLLSATAPARVVTTKFLLFYRTHITLFSNRPSDWGLGKSGQVRLINVGLRFLNINCRLGGSRNNSKDSPNQIGINVSNQLLKKLKSFILKLNQWILLSIPPQPHTLTQIIQII